MSLENAIEKKIKDAIQRGEFDNLKGKGKPLDLSAYFNTPEELRMAYSILKSNDFVPEEVEMLKELSELRIRMAESIDEVQKQHLLTEINEKTLRLRLAIESKVKTRR